MEKFKKTINNSNKYISGSARKKQVKSNDWLVFNTVTMDVVKIFSVKYMSKNNEERRAEIYYPPDYDFLLKKPAIILFAVKRYPMDRGSYVSWAELLAAHGFIAITYEAPDFEKDFINLLAYIHQKNNYLSIDSEKICIMAFCGALNRYFSIHYNMIEKYNLFYGIFFSGTIPSPHKYKYSFPLLIVNSGKDYKVCIQSFLRFKKEADKMELKYKMIDFPDGIHRFDVSQPTEQSKKTIKLMIKEMKKDLL